METLTIPKQHYDEVAALLKSKFKVISTEQDTLCTDVIEVRGKPVILARSDEPNSGPVILRSDA